MSVAVIYLAHIVTRFDIIFCCWSLFVYYM